MFKSKLAIDYVHGDCVRWLQDGGDEGSIVGDIAKVKTADIEALVAESARLTDYVDFTFYSVELGALHWWNNALQKNKRLKKRTKNYPGFRFRFDVDVNNFLKYLRTVERLSYKPTVSLPEWAHTALLEGWRPSPHWKP